MNIRFYEYEDIIFFRTKFQMKINFFEQKCVLLPNHFEVYWKPKSFTEITSKLASYGHKIQISH